MEEVSLSRREVGVLGVLVLLDESYLQIMLMLKGARKDGRNSV